MFSSSCSKWCALCRGISCEHTTRRRGRKANVKSPLPVVLALAALVTGAAAPRLSTSEKLPLRGQTLTIPIYPARRPAHGTIIRGRGDVGWVGLALSMADELSEAGYTVIGVNVRQYLSSFTTGKTHLETRDVPGDYRAILEFAARRALVTRPVIVSGVSEGAALAVLAASDARNHAAIDGVI